LFHLLLSGRIRSTSERTFRANEVANKYTWDNVITFDECEFGPIDPNDRNTMRLAVSRNFVVYESNVVRFAMTNVINALTGKSYILKHLEERPYV